MREQTEMMIVQGIAFAFALMALAISLAGTAALAGRLAG